MNKWLYYRLKDEVELLNQRDKQKKEGTLSDTLDDAKERSSQQNKNLEQITDKESDRMR